MPDDVHEDRNIVDTGLKAELDKELEAVNELMRKRWESMNKGFMEITDKDRRFKLAYAASRDMTNVLRFCIPVAMEVASVYDSRWAMDKSALYRVAMAWTLCFTERDNNWEAMLAAARIPYSSPELLEASTVFSSMLSFVILQYLLSMPYLAETRGEAWPDDAEKVLAGVVWASLADERARKAKISYLHSCGLIPAGMAASMLAASTKIPYPQPWYSRLGHRISIWLGLGAFLKPAQEGIFWSWLKRLADTGEVAIDDAKGKDDAT